MKIMWLYLALVVGTISSNLQAGNEFSTNQIRSMVKQGEILSLETILRNHRQEITGRLLDLEVEYDDGLIIYELEFLQQNGDVVEIKVDAKSGKVLAREIEN